MAAAVAEAPPASPPGAAPASPASEIRFKDLAHYVGLSVVKNVAQAQKGSKSSHSISMDSLRDGDLPSIQQQHGRSERMRTQLEWLRAEQKAEAEQLRKLESSLSDAVLLERRAKQKIAKQQELRDLHAQRALDVSRKIESLQGRISTAEAVPRREPKGRSRELSAGGSLREESRATTAGGVSRSGLLARSAGMVAATRPESGRSWVATPDDGAAVSLREGVEAAYMSAWSANPSLPTAPSLPRLGGSVSAQGSRSAPSLQRPPATAPARRRRPDSPDDSLLMPTVPSPEEELAMRAEARSLLRQEMKERCGSAKEAFKKLDLNGSGSISCQEFADGVSRLGVPWQQITGLKRPRELFNLFDEDKDSKIVFQELFPHDVSEQSHRPTTPDFWRAYAKSRNYQIKSACWQPASCDEELNTWQDLAQRSDEAQLKRKWMCSTMRRLKTRGKSDARCREVVALHLPRGTGPKDREGVNTFSHSDLKGTKKQYSDEVNLPMRRMWKVVGDYKDQRREQKRIYDRLYSVTEALIQRQKNEEAMASLGFNLLGKAMPEQDAGGSLSGGLAMLKANGYDDEAVEDLRKDFLKFADTSELLGKRGFTRLMQAILPSGKFNEREADGWWDEVVKRKGGDKPPEEPKAPEESPEKLKKGVSMDKLLGMGTPGPAVTGNAAPRSQCSFEHFCCWWAENQGKRG